MNVQRFFGALALSILLLAGPLTGQAGAVVIPGDFNDDGDVDFADFADFQACALGPDIPQTDSACTAARLDADQDVDLDDFALFQGCLSGPDNLADPNCACASGQTNCDGTCTNTASDNANCGACGNVCAEGLTCQNGSCSGPCGPLPMALCSGVCTNLNFDNANCGSCGNVCPDGTSCQGVCTPIDPVP